MRTDSLPDEAVEPIRCLIQVQEEALNKFGGTRGVRRGTVGAGSKVLHKELAAVPPSIGVWKKGKDAVPTHELAGHH
jgi:hypothetical protein